MCALGMMFKACTEKENVGGTITDSLLVEPTDTIPRPTEGEWIDLGLPSGLLWASCNLGANTPTEYGNYYAWGETQPKEVYDLITYTHTYSANGYNDWIAKYCNLSGYGNIDTLTILEDVDDAATANLGNGARTPTKEEWGEVYRNCTIKYVHYSNNGEDYDYITHIGGHLLTGPNGNSIFLPCAGYRKGNGYGGYRNSSRGYYWSSSLYVDDPHKAWFFYTHVDVYSDCGIFPAHRTRRDYGLSVRAVRPQ